MIKSPFESMVIPSINTWHGIRFTPEGLGMLKTDSCAPNALTFEDVAGIVNDFV